MIVYYEATALGDLGFSFKSVTRAIKKAWGQVKKPLVGAALIVSGGALTIGTGGAFAPLGMALVGAGIGTVASKGQGFGKPLDLMKRVGIGAGAGLAIGGAYSLIMAGGVPTLLSGGKALGTVAEVGGKMFLQPPGGAPLQALPSGVAQVLNTNYDPATGLPVQAPAEAPAPEGPATEGPNLGMIAAVGLGALAVGMIAGKRGRR